MRTTTTYDRIVHRVTRSFVCEVCGKRATRSTTFGQTLNPFNRNADGLPKIVPEIRAELEVQAEGWHPTLHERCERARLPEALR